MKLEAMGVVNVYLNRLEELMMVLETQMYIVMNKFPFPLLLTFRMRMNMIVNLLLLNHMT